MKKIYKTPTVKFRTVVLDSIMAGSDPNLDYNPNNNTGDSGVTEADSKASYWSTEW